MHIKVLLWCPLLHIKLKNWARSVKVYVDTDIISDHERLYFNEEALWRATPTYIIIYYRDSDFYKSLLYIKSYSDFSRNSVTVYKVPIEVYKVEFVWNALYHSLK